MTNMDYEIRLATADDIAPVLDLAWRMFVKYDAPDYGAEHTERMREAIEDRLKDLERNLKTIRNVIGRLER